MQISTVYELNSNIEILNEEIDRLNRDNNLYMMDLKTIRTKYIDYNHLNTAY